MTLADELENGIAGILRMAWNVRDGQVVPATEDVALNGGAVRLQATFLYADLSESSRLATDFQQRTAAKVVRSFLYAMSRLVATHGGSIRSFDGDRVMGVFIGNRKNTNAANCALKMNYVVTKILKPRLEGHFASLSNQAFTIAHGVGVDTGQVLAVRAGQRGDNDLVWVGRAPNRAAKLSDLREPPYHSFITDQVFDHMRDEVKYGGPNQKLMWERRSITSSGLRSTVYRSSWWRKP